MKWLQGLLNFFSLIKKIKVGPGNVRGRKSIIYFFITFIIALLICLLVNVIIKNDNILMTLFSIIVVITFALFLIKLFITQIFMIIFSLAGLFNEKDKGGNILGMIFAILTLVVIPLCYIIIDKIL